VDAVKLRLDWCSYQAAKYACEKWHYSKTMPRAKSVYQGVWEDGEFIGSVVFGLGGGAATDGSQFGLSHFFEVAELERVALRFHASPVTKIVKVALTLLVRQSPGLRLVVSYADPEQGHHGGIYQGGNWVYVGRTSPDWYLLDKDGRRWHSRVVSNRSPKLHFGRPTVGIHISQGVKVITEGKHKYVLPLDAEMRARIAPMAKHYPKRAGSIVTDAVANPATEGGLEPTPALHSTHEVT
jgi:hypothetical protein